MSIHTMADEAYEKRLEAENARLKAALSAATKRAEDEGKRAYDLESWIMAVAHVTENEEWNKVCTRANDIFNRLTAAEHRAATAEARLKEAGNIIGDFRKITEVVGGVRHRLPYTPPFFTDLWDKTEARSGEFLNKLKTGAHRDG